MGAEMIWILAPLGSFLWRIRGGLLNAITGKANWMGFNDTVVRLIWSLGMAGAYGALTHLSWWTLLLAFALFAGCTVVGWFGAALLPTKLKDVALLSLSGAIRMALVSVVLLSPWPLAVGVLCGPIYWLGAKLPAPKPWMFWGEWLFGGCVGASLALAVVL
jgi:uncharacterized membrane protein AbrB (regulator of aidB expression)